jgi:hypothetical protein
MFKGNLYTLLKVQVTFVSFSLISVKAIDASDFKGNGFVN